MIGEVLMEIGRFEEAERQLRQALAQANRMKLDPEIVAARHALARLSTILNEPEKAEEHVTVAKAVADRRDPEQFLPALFAISAWSCAKSGDYADGRRMLKVAEKSLDKLPAPRRCQIMLMSARTHRVMGDEDTAIKIAIKAAGMSASRGFALQNLEAKCFLATTTLSDSSRKVWESEANALVAQIAGELEAPDAIAFAKRFPQIS
jgi:tetratricopeptide (TPR) repeat protein